MKFSNHLNSLLFLLFFSCQAGYASTPVKTVDVSKINRVEITEKNDRLRLQRTAGLLANYEIEAKKLIDMVDEGYPGVSIQKKAEELMDLSENVFDSAKFRLPQCEDYLTKSMELKDNINIISHEDLEKNYHLDGALPKAPGECYHTKDLFVHPATVIVLTRDDPALSEATKSSIKAEITEVLGHTEMVRQLVIY